ncbi:chemotaxis protein CheW [Methylophaga sp.]|uniref:chemotaxis protein CheW n=1 Tax=Methylophaga sp. TaxID=2024840 RepID=UPI003F6A2635
MASIQTPEDIISLLKDMERRSKQKAAGLDQEALGETWSAIGFRIGEHHFVIPIIESREVFPLPEQVTPVPKSQSWVFGMVNLRGELLPVLDLNLYLHGKPSKLSKRSRIMVINHSEISSGVLVDEVFGLKHFQQEPGPVAASRPVNLTPYLTGSMFQQNVHWDVFSFAKLINDPRFMNAAA